MNAETSFNEALRNFIGSTQLFFHPVYKKPQYTDGVRYFLHEAGQGNGAFWLFDILATEPAIGKQAQDFASIRVVSRNNRATICVDDGNRTSPVFMRVIEYTDLDPGEYQFYWIGEVLMLATEY